MKVDREKVGNYRKYSSGHGLDFKVGIRMADRRWHGRNDVGAQLRWVLRFRLRVISEPELRRRRRRRQWRFHFHAKTNQNDFLNLILKWKWSNKFMVHIYIFGVWSLRLLLRYFRFKLCTFVLCFLSLLSSLSTTTYVFSKTNLSCSILTSLLFSPMPLFLFCMN